MCQMFGIYVSVPVTADLFTSNLLVTSMAAVLHHYLDQLLCMFWSAEVVVCTINHF